MKKIYVGLSLISAVLIVLGYWVINASQNRIVFIKTAVVFEQFEMTKEKRASFDQVSGKRRSLIDSMELHLKVLGSSLQQKSSDAEIRRFEILRRDFISKKEAFTQDDEALSRKYDEEIMSRINQYAKEFALKNSYDYVLGASGDGSIMYASDEKDATEKFVEYCNNQYKGIK